MNDPEEPGRFPGDEDAERQPLIPPPRTAADDRLPPARRRGVPAPREGDGSHAGPVRDRDPAERETARTDPDPSHDRAALPHEGSPREHASLEHASHERAAHDSAPLEHDEGHSRSDGEAGAEPSRGVPRPQGEQSSVSPPRAGPPVGPTGPVPSTPASSTSAEPVRPLEHSVLKSLLGAWALCACSAEETDAVEAHLTDCAPCAGEALRLRDAVALLHPEDSLGLNPRLRGRVLESALGRRPARIPIPSWAAPFDAEAARLDALLRDMAAEEWRAPVTLRWFEGEEPRVRTATVAEVIGHLMAVDGLVGGVLRLSDPLVEAGVLAEDDVHTSLMRPAERTEAYWRAAATGGGKDVRAPWRDQTHALVRGATLVGPSLADHTVSGIELPLRDAFLDRAFECWVHACDIAEAVDYPHPPPQGGHLHQLVELAARMLPFVLAGRRQSGLAAPPRHLGLAGAPGRSLHLEVEGSGGGDWFIPLDSPGGAGSPDGAVAHVALDGVEFCQLVAGHVSPLEAAAGAAGDPEAIRDVLFATASMSRL